MGYFDLLNGEFDLLMKKRGRGNSKAEWKSVMMTDRLYPEEIADCVERWSKNYKVIAARFNGREVKIPEGYHWEVRFKDDVIGCYKTREEAKAVTEERRMSNWGKPLSEHIMIGTIVFVKD